MSDTDDRETDFTTSKGRPSRAYVTNEERDLIEKECELRAIQVQKDLIAEFRAMYPPPERKRK